MVLIGTRSRSVKRATVHRIYIHSSQIYDKVTLIYDAVIFGTSVLIGGESGFEEGYSTDIGLYRNL